MSREWSGQVDEDEDGSGEGGRESSADEHRSGAAGRRSGAEHRPGEGTDTFDEDGNPAGASGGVETSGVVGDWVATDSRSDLDGDHSIPSVPTDPPIRSFWLSVAVGTLVAVPFSADALDSVLLAVTLATGLAGGIRAGSPRSGGVAGAVTGPVALAVLLFVPAPGSAVSEFGTVTTWTVAAVGGSFTVGYGAVCGAIGGAVGRSSELFDR